MDDRETIKNFTQSPNLILYGMPERSTQDKWTLLALMGMCWDRSKTGPKKTLQELEGPYKLTLREIEEITGTKYTTLRNREGKEPREGILERWQKVGYLSIVDEVPVDETTGKVGKKRTYLYIHLRKIWDDNTQFVNHTPGKLVSEANVNQPHDVSPANKDVTYANNNFSEANKDVSGSRSNITPINTNKDILKTDNTGMHFSSVENNGRQGARNGFIDAVLRPCCRDLGGMEGFETYSQRANAIFMEAQRLKGCELDTFRTKMRDLHSRIRDNPLPDGQVSKIEYFHQKLCRAFGVDFEAIGRREG